MKPDELFYISQKALILKDGEVLVLNDPIEGLDYPGGKIQEGETDLAESLKREVREEVNLEVNVGEPFYSYVFTKSFEGQEHSGKSVLVIVYKCDYISGDLNLSKEHDKFSWVNKDNFNSVDDGTSYFEILKKYFDK